MEADPRFPDRPTHPDFERLSEIVIDHDTRTMGPLAQEEFDKIVAEVVDGKSLAYVAVNRAGMLLQARPQEPPVMMAMAGIIDGFMLGVKFAQQGGHVDA